MLLRGKGRKERIVSIANDLVRPLRAFMHERGRKSHEEQPLFVGTHCERLTRLGATHIVRRVVAAATRIRPELASKSVSPHVLRHTLATTLLQSGVDLLTNQAWLGHAQVDTTHRYAAAEVEMTRRGLDKAGVAGSQPARLQPKDTLLRLLRPSETEQLCGTQAGTRPGNAALRATRPHNLIRHISTDHASEPPAPEAPRRESHSACPYSPSKARP
ncbi:tyrosine-type recombinase/integrase [Sinorhizobium medicae]